MARYVGSGIPVIAALKPWTAGQTDGHAVVVVGDTFTPFTTATLSASAATMAEMSPYFLVHDDQRGPNLRMPVLPGMLEAETGYNVQEHLQALIIPLPDKVFMTAELAEIKARDRLLFFQSEWPGLKAEIGDAIGSSVDLAEAVLEAMNENRIVARTYLTMGWKYKARVHKYSPSTVLRSYIAVHDLPKMVWVTEFGMLEDMNKIDPSERRIFGHCVVDATSTVPNRSPVIVHMPGILWLTTQADPEFFPETEDRFVPLKDDVVYPARWRRPN